MNVELMIKSNNFTIQFKTKKGRVYNMLQLSYIEIFLRLIPEVLVYCWACYVFSKSMFNKEKWLITGVVGGFSAYIIRMLPINFGVHTILFLITFIFIVCLVNKIEPLKVIPISLISISSMYFFEWLNFYMLRDLFKIPLNKVAEEKNLFIKHLYLYPSLLFLVIAIILCNFFFKLVIERKVHNVSHGENIN